VEKKNKEQKVIDLFIFWWYNMYIERRAFIGKTTISRSLLFTYKD